MPSSRESSSKICLHNYYLGLTTSVRGGILLGFLLVGVGYALDIPILLALGWTLITLGSTSSICFEVPLWNERRDGNNDDPNDPRNRPEVNNTN